MIRVSVVGPTQVSIDNQPVSLPTAKDRAVIALLAVADLRPITSRELTSALWPAPDSKAKHSFNQSLSSLRKTLTRRFLCRDGTDLHLSNEVSSDHVVYVNLLRTHSLAEARLLRRGQLLCDLNALCSDELDEILLDVRSRFEKRVNEAVLIALQELAQAGDWIKAAELGEYVVNNHTPSDPVAFMALLSSLMNDGPIILRAIVDALRRNHYADTIERIVVRARRAARFLRNNGFEVRMRPSLTGRKAEIGVFEMMLDDARQGRGSTLELVGDPGIGKSTLAQHLALRAALHGASVIVLQGRDAEKQVGGAGLQRLVNNPFVRRFRAEIAITARRDLKKVLADSSEAARGLLDPNASHANRLAEVLTSLLRLVARHRPTVLLVDDFHALDPTTRHCLQELGAHANQMRLLIVFARRAVNGEASLSRLTNSKRTVTLKPFDLREVAEFCSQTGMAGDPKCVLIQTGGHPLLLSEVARGGSGSGRSLTVNKYLQVTVDELPIEGRQLLQAAAILGCPSGANTIACVAGLRLSQAALHLDDLVQRNLLKASGQGFVVGHDLLREYVIGSTGSARRELLHMRAGRVLRQLRAPLALVAPHYLQSSYSRFGGQLALRAARQSERRLAFREAAELYASALPHLQSQRRRAEIAYRIGILCFTIGEEQQAITVLAEYSKAIEATEFRARGELIRLALQTLSGGVQNARELKSECEPHLAECRQNGHWRDYLRGLQTILRCADLKGDDGTVRDVLPKLKSCLDECPDIAVKADATRFAGHLTSRYISSERGLDITLSAVNLTEDMDPQARASTLATLGVVAVEAGRLRMGEDACAKAFAVAEAAGHIHQCLSINNIWGVALLEMGRHDEANKKLAFVVEKAGASHRALVGTALSNRAWLALENHDWRSAEDYARAAMEYSDLFITIAVISRAVLGFAALEQGRMAEACRIADTVADIQPAFSGSDLSLAFMLRARLAQISGQKQRAKELLSNGVRAYESRHVLGRLRVELALARFAAPSDIHEAERKLISIQEMTSNMGATRLNEEARRSLARLRRGRLDTD